jgi:hypothetical protein
MVEITPGNASDSKNVFNMAGEESLLDGPLSSKRIFISGINSLVGYTLFEFLRNDDVAIVNDAQPNKFVGSMLDNGSPNPSPTIKVLNLQKKPKTF